MEKNNLPQSWEIVPLSEIAQINPPKPEKDSVSDNLEVSFVPMKNVEGLTGKVNLSETRKYFKVRTGYTYFQNDDIIFAKITPCMENGKIAITTGLKNEIGFGSTEFHVIRLRDKISQKFYFWYLMQDDFRNKAQHKMKGTAGQLRVSSKYMKDILIPLPPLIEQERIVQKIEELFSELNNAKNTLNNTKLQLTQYKQSLLKFAFKGKLTEKWRKTNQNIQSAVDIIVDYHDKLVTQNNEKSKRSKSGKAKKPQNLIFYEAPIIIQNLQNWARVNFVNFCTLQRGFDLPKSARKRGKYPIVSSSGITGYHSEYKVKGEGVTIGRSGSIGNVSYSDSDYWPLNTTLFVTDFNGNHPKFIYYFLQFFKAERFGASTAVPTLDRKLFFKEKVNIPPLEEQKQITSKIEQGFSLIKNSQNIVNSALQRLDIVKTSILKQAFEGKLVPQDPNDESASEILKRIKLEN